jgi:hypothetical protein
MAAQRDDRCDPRRQWTVAPAEDRQPPRAGRRQPYRSGRRQPRRASRSHFHRASRRQSHRASRRQPRRASRRHSHRAGRRQPRRASRRQPHRASRRESHRAGTRWSHRAIGARLVSPALQRWESNQKNLRSPVGTAQEDRTHPFNSRVFQQCCRAKRWGQIDATNRERRSWTLLETLGFTENDRMRRKGKNTNGGDSL